MGMGFVPIWLRQLLRRRLLHKTTLTTGTILLTTPTDEKMSLGGGKKER